MRFVFDIPSQCIVSALCDTLFQLVRRSELGSGLGAWFTRSIQQVLEGVGGDPPRSRVRKTVF